MEIKQFLKLSLGLFRHPIYTKQLLIGDKSTVSKDVEESIRSGANWLLAAQKNSVDGEGYSRRFSLLSGWDRGYIETTGYIIPTMLEVSHFLGDTRYKKSAYAAADWLLKVQTIDGAFTDVDSYVPQVFDTGQVLLGLNRMFLETKDERFLSALTKASRWLCDVQEKDGSWIQYAYNDRPHAYYSRVGAALIEAGQISGIEEYVAAGLRNLEWVSDQQKSNGYYRYSEFRPKEDAILHTIVYVLEGFSMAYQLTGDKRWADKLISDTDTLGLLLNKEGLLYSQYDTQWKATNTEYCVTGLAQYAGVCFDVATITNDLKYRSWGENIVTRLCQWQQKDGEDLNGALSSSVPFWGYYGGMDFFNWNIKFFLDAALKERAHQFRGNSSHNDGE